MTLAPRVPHPGADAATVVAKAAEAPEAGDSGSSWSGFPLPAEAQDQLIGTTLHETYIVERVLGEGGMGRIYEARHTRIRTKRFALKVLHAEYALNTELQLRFQREAEAAAAIEHPGVVGTYDLGKTPQGWPYMVCDYLDGEDLNSRIQSNGALPAETVIHIALQLCEALTAAHAQGVIHRDLKPHNVFVLGENEGEQALQPTVKVLDFGLSRFVGHDSKLTRSGVVLGTPGYMSPEQARGQTTGLLTDIYGIGAIMYAAATGCPPFKESSPQQTVLAVMQNEPRRPRTLNEHIPVALEAIILKAMARELDDRFQSAEQLLRTLQRLAERLNPDRASAAALSTSPHLALIGWMSALMGLVALWTTSAFLGALSLRGLSFRPVDSDRWFLLGMGVAVLVPTALLCRRFLLTSWRHTERVALLAARARTPIVAGACAYGLGSIAARLGGDLLERLTNGRYPTHPVEWVGWLLLLPVVGATGASAATAWGALAAVRSAWLRPFLRSMMLTSAISIGIGLLVFGLMGDWPLRSHTRPAVTPVPNTQAPPSPTAASAAVLAEQEPQRATVEELRAARRAGTEALQALSKRYPSDPEVLRSLVIAHGQVPSELEQAIVAMGRLLAIEPAFRKDHDLARILSRGPSGSEATRAATLEVLREHMADHAGDLVLDWLSKQPEGRAALSAYFEALRADGLATPAATLAFELLTAPSCEARLQLLPRLRAEGDVRSANILRSTLRPPEPCPDDSDCSAPCQAQRESFQNAIDALEASPNENSSR